MTSNKNPKTHVTLGTLLGQKRRHPFLVAAMVVLFSGLPAAHRAMAEDNLCASSDITAVTLDFDKATEQDIEGAGNHYTNIILSLSRSSSDELLTVTSQNIGALLEYCIGGDSLGSPGYIKSPFPVMDPSGFGLAHIVIDKTRFDVGELLNRINAKTAAVKVVISRR